MHALFNGSGGKEEYLDDEDRVKKALIAVPESCGLLALTRPKVLRYAPTQLLKEVDPLQPVVWDGICGSIFLVSGRFSIYTFPAKQYLWADLFSLLDFDTMVAFATLHEYFPNTNFDVEINKRGLPLFEQMPVVAQQTRERV